MTRTRTGLVAAAGALLLLLALGAGACGIFEARGDYEVAAEFERTYNLFAGSPVRVLGVEVGKVSDLSVEPGSEVVTATLLIDGDVDLPADAAALIVPESLLGERYVQFEPPYTGGPTLEAGATIPLERTVVPFEFDEVLEGLNQFVGGLDAPEVGRMFDNLSTVLDGQGRTLGQVIDQARDAIGVLADNDDELVALAARLADLNETLATRDQALGAIIEDWNTVAGTLASDRTDIDGALRGLVRVTDELGALLEAHGDHLRDDIDVLARVGRTANRNLDNLSMMILGGAELFRHAERIIDREHNWLPLQNHSQSIGPELARTISERLYGVCLRVGMTEEECDELPLDEILGQELCLDPIVPCPEDGSTKSVPEGVRDVLASSPELRDAIRDRDPADDGEAADDDDGGLDDLLGDLLRGDEEPR